jgi:hypothetical protein
MVIAETLTEILSCLATSDHRAARGALGRLAPGLHIEGSLAGAPGSGSPATFARSEIVTIEHAVPGETCAQLAETIATLRGHGIPGVFVYAFDEPWAIGEDLRARLPGYELVADAWAFHVLPGRTGWSAHRGVSHVLLDRERPEVVNAWVALSDAPIDRSCMHFVALDDDPAYPDRLDSIAITKPHARPVVAGTALVWNANTLHWGGPCEPTAAGPRTSCTFTLVREDAAERFGARTVRPAGLSFADRLDLIADQIVTYGSGQPDISEEILEWARASSALRAISRP